MDELADRFFELTCDEAGNLAMPAEGSRRFEHEARNAYAASPAATLEELATLALFFEQRQQGVASNFLRRLGNQLNGRFQGLWDLAHADHESAQEERQRASRELLGCARRARPASCAEEAMSVLSVRTLQGGLG